MKYTDYLLPIILTAAAILLIMLGVLDNVVNALAVKVIGG